jgi:membrane protease subunit HflK
MDGHTHESDAPRLRPGAAPPGAGAAEQALAGALRTMFGALRIVMIIALAGLLISNTRLLRQNQRAVILRFGKIVGTEASRVRGPGLVFALPQPIDEIIVVDAARVQVLDVDDFMYRASAREGGTEELGETLDPALDGYTVTGDANIVHTMWRIEYQIDDVVNYVLNVVDPEELIRSSLAAAVVHTSSEFTVEEALWGEGLELRARVQERLQARLDAASSGIRIVAVRTPTRQEPKQTTAAFRDLQDAGLERDKVLQEAQRYSEQVLAAVAGDAAPRLVEEIEALAAAEEAPEAERDPARIEALRTEVAATLDGAAGQVAKTFSDAKTYRVRVREDAKAMAATFATLNEKYKKNPRIFVREFYQSAIEEVLAAAGYTFAVQPGKEVRITIEPPRKKQQPAAQGEAEISRTPEERARSRMMGP